METTIQQATERWLMLSNATLSLHSAASKEGRGILNCPQFSRHTQGLQLAESSLSNQKIPPII
jgi:hypothetical protein